MVNGPSDCKANQIFNPETKRCIAIDGIPGKKLIKAFKENIVKLPEEDVIKVIKELKWTNKEINSIIGENKEFAIKCLEKTSDVKKDDTVKKTVKKIATPKPNVPVKPVVLADELPSEKYSERRNSRSRSSSPVPAKPTVPPTKPTVPPTKPTVPPAKPTVPPAKPTVPPAKPTVSPAKPTVPPANPTVPPAKPTVPPAKLPVKSSKKTVVAQPEKKECLGDTIWNPTSKRCVDISGTAGTKIIKEIIAGSINISQEELNKILASKTLKKTLRDELIKLSTTIAVQPNQVISTKDIPEDVKNRIHKFVEEWKKKKEAEFIDEHHTKYCKTKKLTDLKKPIVNWSASIQLPIQRLKSNPSVFSLQLLNNSKQTFNLEHITGTSFKFNNYSIRNILYKNIKDSVSTYIENSIDIEWLGQMNEYIKNLPTKDIFTMIGYTFYGDTVANNFLRKKLNKTTFLQDLETYDKWWYAYYPLFFQALEEINNVQQVETLLKDKKDINLNITQSPSYGIVIDKSLIGSRKITELLQIIKNNKLKISDYYMLVYFIGRYLSYETFWAKVIARYIRDLDNIINNAPPLTKPLIVYRGVKDDYYLKGKEGFVYTTNSFISTSINLESALKFAGPLCCFKRITLLPGTRTLLMAGISKFLNEIEFLLGTSCKFYITKEKRFISRTTTDMCPPPVKQRIMVTDAVVIKS